MGRTRKRKCEVEDSDEDFEEKSENAGVKKGKNETTRAFRFTKDQVAELEKSYQFDAYPDWSCKKDIALQLKIRESQVITWFLERRAKQKKLESLQKSSISSKVVNKKTHEDEEFDEKSKDKSENAGVKKGKNETTRAFRFTKDQVAELEKSYQYDTHPDWSCIRDLALELKVRERQVNTWFGERRGKQKKLESLQKSSSSSKVVNKKTHEDEESDEKSKEKSEKAGDQEGKNKSNRFTKHQVAEMKKSYKINAYPDKGCIRDLAIDVKLTEVRVKSWFFAWRAKQKKLKNLQKSLSSSKEVNKKTHEDEEWHEKSKEKSKNVAVKKRRGEGSRMYRFTKYQLTVMKKSYQNNVYPDKGCIRDLALHLNLTETQVMRWFVKRKFKQKKLESLQKSPASSKALNKKTHEDEESDAKSKEKSENDGIERVENVTSKWYKFSAQEITELEKAYKINAYPDKSCIRDLALKAKLTEALVNIWFKARRRKQRKQKNLQKSPSSSKALNKKTHEDEESEEDFKDKSENVGDKGGPNEISRYNRFTTEETTELEKVYETNKFPNVTELKNLASKLHYTPKQVKGWFIVRRRIERKQTDLKASTVTSATPRKRKRDDEGDKSEKSVTSAVPGNKSVWSVVDKRFTTEEITELEKVYATKKFPTVNDHKNLSSKFNHTVRQVQGWFRTRRRKHRQQIGPKPSSSTPMSFKVTKENECDDKEQAGVNSDPEEETSGNEESKSVWSAVEWKYTTHELMEMEKLYSVNAYPDRSEMENLASRTDHTAYQIRQWFNHRRATARRPVDLKASTVTSEIPRKIKRDDKGEEFDVESDYEESTSGVEESKNGLSEIEKRFTAEEIKKLETAYAQNSYPHGFCLKNIALELDITEVQVMNWVLDRRYKDKKIEKVQKPTFVTDSFNESNSEDEDADNKQGTGLQPAADDKNGDEKGPAVIRKPKLTETHYRKLDNYSKKPSLFSAAVNELSAEFQLTNFQVQRWYRKKRFIKKEVSLKRRICEDEVHNGPSWYTTAPQRTCFKCKKTFSNVQQYGTHMRLQHLKRQKAICSVPLIGKLKVKANPKGQYFYAAKSLACNYPRTQACTKEGCTYKTYSQSNMNLHLLTHVKGLQRKRRTMEYHKPPNSTRIIPMSKVQSLSGLPPETARKSNFKIFCAEESVDEMTSIKKVIEKLLPRKWKEEWAYSCYVLISEEFDDVYFGTVEGGSSNKVCRTWIKKNGWYVQDRVADKAAGISPTRFLHFGTVVFKSDGSEPYHAMQCAEFVATYKWVLLLLANAVLPEKVAKSYNLQNRRRGFNNCNWPELKIQLERDLLNGEDPLTVEPPLHLCRYYTDNVNQKTTYKIPYTTGSVPSNIAHHVLKMKIEDESYGSTLAHVMDQAAPRDDLTILYGSYVMITKDGNNPYYGTTSGGYIAPCIIWKKVKNKPYYNREDLKASPLFYYFGTTVYGSKTDDAVGAVGLAEYDRTMRFAYQMLVYKSTRKKSFKPFNICNKFSGFVGCDREKIVTALLTCWMNKEDPIRMTVPLNICPFYNENTTSNWYLNCVESENEIGPLGDYQGNQCPVKFIKPFNLLSTGIFPLFTVAKYFGLKETSLHNAAMEYNVPFDGKYTKPQPNEVILQCLEEVKKGKTTLKDVLDRCNCTMNELRRCHYANKKKHSADNHQFILDQTDFLAMMSDVHKYKISYNEAKKKYMASSSHKSRMSVYVLQVWNTTGDVLNRQYVQNMMQRRTDILQQMGLSKEEINQHSYLVNNGARIGLSADVVNDH